MPFFGAQVGTFGYNIGVVWLMCAVLYLTLYYESIRKGILLVQKGFSKKK